MQKIMIDTGMTRRVNCRGVEPDTVELIGSALSRELDARGCETMTSCGVPDPDEGFGRPSRCADVARRWGADCLLRLYVRAAADPCAGSADAMVSLGRSGAADSDFSVAGSGNARRRYPLGDRRSTSAQNPLSLCDSDSPLALPRQGIPDRRVRSPLRAGTCGWFDGIVEDLGGRKEDLGGREPPLERRGSLPPNLPHSPRTFPKRTRLCNAKICFALYDAGALGESFCF